MSLNSQPATELLRRETRKPSPGPLHRPLLACGIAYAALYLVATELVAPALYDGYSRLSQAISELSATGSPAEPFLTTALPIFNTLLIAFGLGVWSSAHEKRALRFTGSLLLAQGLTAFLWLLAPMSQRDVIATEGGTFNDDLHIVLSALSVAFILSEIGFSAAALGRRFRLYSVLTLAAILASGIATFVLASGIASGSPTPWLGLSERISMWLWLLWMAVLATTLLRTARTRQALRERADAQPSTNAS